MRKLFLVCAALICIFIIAGCDYYPPQTDVLNDSESWQNTTIFVNINASTLVNVTPITNLIRCVDNNSLCSNATLTNDYWYCNIDDIFKCKCINDTCVYSEVFGNN